MRVWVIACLAVFGFSTSAVAAPSVLDDSALPGAGRYERCLNYAGQDANAALAAALDWERQGGAAPASHCAALALVSLRRYGEAAGRLDQLGRTMKVSAPERAALFDQAGNAWLLAANAAAAQASFTAALALTPGDPEILTDRARARAMQKDWQGADSDLTAAIPQSPDRAALYVLRASARHAEGRKADARADIDAALSVAPNYPEALLQRGAMKYEAGDTAGAMADWQAVVAKAPSSRAAETARKHIADTTAPPASSKQ